MCAVSQIERSLSPPVVLYIILHVVVLATIRTLSEKIIHIRTRIIPTYTADCKKLDYRDSKSGNSTCNQ